MCVRVSIASIVAPTMSTDKRQVLDLILGVAENGQFHLLPVQGTKYNNLVFEVILKTSQPIILNFVYFIDILTVHNLVYIFLRYIRLFRIDINETQEP